MSMGNGVEVRMVETGMKDRQAALIAAAIIWTDPNLMPSDENVFGTAEKYLEWLRKEP